MTEAKDIWRTDPNTLQDVILDRPAVEARLGECPPLERVWILSLLGRHDEAREEGQQLLARSQDRFKPLAGPRARLPAPVPVGGGGALQEQALRLAFTRTREALVRHHIGRRLFDEARYRDAASSQACTACARACLGEKMVADLAACIRTDLDCADICAATGNILTRQTATNTAITRPALEVCRTACAACADECDQHAGMHGHCRNCAEACRRCEAACTALLSAPG